MPAIGITGGVSTGKTTFCDCLRELVPAAKFFDADQAARELVDLDPEVQKELATEFGPGIFSSNGRLNREQLRAIIFQDAAKKTRPRTNSPSTNSPAMERSSENLFFPIFLRRYPSSI